MSCISLLPAVRSDLVPSDCRQEGIHAAAWSWTHRETGCMLQLQFHVEVSLNLLIVFFTKLGRTCFMSAVIGNIGGHCQAVVT